MRGEARSVSILAISFIIFFILMLIVIFSYFGQGDSDGDGLSDYIENTGWDVFVYNVTGTEKKIHVVSSPYKEDTDRDGLTDYEEFEMLGKLNPESNDTDNDGLTDYEEMKLYQTQPNKQDSEIWPDGLKDGIEVKGWSITVDGEIRKVSSNPKLYDTDGDGLSDYEEWEKLTDPSSKDTDSDGFIDQVDLYPCKDLKFEFVVERISLSENYSRDAKVYFMIRPEMSEIKMTGFIEIGRGDNLDVTDFIEIVNPSDYKTLYPIEIQISAFDNNTQETTTQYISEYGTITVKFDKPLKINHESSSFKFEFDPEDAEKAFQISGDDLSLSFKLRVK